VLPIAANMFEKFTTSLSDNILGELMDSTTIALYLGIAIAVAAFIYKQYLRLKPQIDEALEDGVLSLGEVKDLIEEAEEVIDEVKEFKEELPSLSALKKMKKADLEALCEKYDLDTEGTKAVLIEKLKNHAN
tara:strand:- start:25 stop:420 length:396 start_codon:yes stop_codon:yes gene_type:complete